MRLTSLSIQNFRAITNLFLEELADGVVLAGPNGCGKSCVLDAIRLLKSAYGSYEQDEWQNWLGEFQIDLNREPRALLDLFQDPKLPLSISGTFSLSNQEQTFLRDNSEDLLAAAAWRAIHPNAGSRTALVLSSLTNQGTGQEYVKEYVRSRLPYIQRDLERNSQEAALVIQPFRNPDITGNRLLELI